MITNFVVHEGYEISLRLRQSVEERIARLERDAEADQAFVAQLDDIDHIGRQMKLVANERAEAQRMRRFLERTRTRSSKSLVEP